MSRENGKKSWIFWGRQAQERCNVRSAGKKRLLAWAGMIFGELSTLIKVSLRAERSRQTLEWIWYFLIYSTLGFDLEVLYAWCTGQRRDRKGALVLPLCPVYGLGAIAILMLPLWVREHPWALFLVGGLTATAVEYVVSAAYEWGLRVSFWDYTGLPGNIRGRVCLPFALAWGVLAVGLVRWVHPAVAAWAAEVPDGVSLAAAVTAAADLILAGVLMRRSRSRDCLRWYRHVLPSAQDQG